MVNVLVVITYQRNYKAGCPRQSEIYNWMSGQFVSNLSQANTSQNIVKKPENQSLVGLIDAELYFENKEEEIRILY